MSKSLSGQRNQWLFDQDYMDDLETRTTGLFFLDDFIQSYINRNKDFHDVFAWTTLFTYQFGDFTKQIFYRRSYGEARWNKRLATEAYGEALLALIGIGRRCGLDLHEAIMIAVTKYNEQEWKKKARPVNG